MRKKILDGKLESFYKSKCLLEQVFFKDEKRKVKDLIDDLVSKVGEKIEVSRILSWRVGES